MLAMNDGDDDSVELQQNHFQDLSSRAKLRNRSQGGESCGVADRLWPMLSLHLRHVWSRVRFSSRRLLGWFSNVTLLVLVVRSLDFYHSLNRRQIPACNDYVTWKRLGIQTRLSVNWTCLTPLLDNFVFFSGLKQIVNYVKWCIHLSALTWEAYSVLIPMSWSKPKISR